MSEKTKQEKKKFKRSILHKIINFFVGIFIILSFLLIVFFGFSQTKTFRNFLRENIITIVSESINGELEIEEIEGSILTSVILHNTKLISENDTIISAKELVLKASPIHLLLKRILVREFIFRDAEIKLLEDESGKWNYEKLSEVSSTSSAIDTSESSSSFPFTIQVNKVTLENISFIRQTYTNLNSKKYYKHLTSDDIRLNNLYLDAKFFINLSSSTMRFHLNNLSVNPNFDAFKLNKLSAEIELTENYASVNNLRLITDSSDVRLSLKMDELNLLGNTELKGLKDYPIEVNFEAYPIKFSDLYTFIDQIDFLNDGVNVKLLADGYFGNLNIKKLNLSFLNSVLHAKGIVKDLHIPEKLYLDVNIFDGYVVEEEACYIVKGLDIPEYKDLNFKDLNAYFKGQPTEFDAGIMSNVGKGNIKIYSYFNFNKEEMQYDAEFETRNLNLFSVINTNTSLNAKGFIKGIGTDPNNMDTKANVIANNSFFDAINFDSLNLTSEIKSKLLDVKLATNLNDGHLNVKGNLDLTARDEPTYNVEGLINNLMLNKFTNDPQDSSDLNLKFFAKGKNLSIDSLIGNLELQLKPSYLRNLKLDETNIALSLLLDNYEREIKLTSDFVDFNIFGNFSLEKAIELLTYEGKTISNIFLEDIQDFNPLQDENDSLVTLIKKQELPQIVKEEIEFDYSFKFKDFDLIALFLKNDALNIIGHGGGKVKNDSSYFAMTASLILDNFLTKEKDNIFYLSGTEVDINFNRDNKNIDLNKLFGSISITSDKIFFGSEITNLETDLIFNQSELFFNTALNYEKNLYAELEGKLVTTINEDRMYLNNILFAYKDIPWNSYDTCKIFSNDDGVQISDLNFVNKSSIISLAGQLNNDITHNFFVQAKDIPGDMISSILFDENTNTIGGELNLQMQSTGFLSNPAINIDLNFYNIMYRETNLGSFSCVMNHNNKNTLLDVDFINSKINPNFPLLTIDGYLPLIIDYTNLSDIVQYDDDIFIALRANNFNLESLGGTIPFVKDQSGKVNSEIDISGSLNDLSTDGFFNISDGRFTALPNNLEYNVNLETSFKKQKGTIKDFTLENREGPRYRGKIKGFGELVLNKLPYSEFDLTLSGDLALLERRYSNSRSEIYGDLLINTGDKWKLNYKDNVYNFIGDVIVDRADLIYTSKDNNNFADNNDIIYEIIEDTTNFKFDSDKYLRLLKDKKNIISSVEEKSKIKFNFDTELIIKNLATINFIIAPDLNQQLIVETTGNLSFKKKNDELQTQGLLVLQNGSRLEFFKTFDAVGTVKFENEIADPHLDITATYTNEISNFEGSGSDKDVAVKLRLNSSFSNLKENLSKKDIFSIYVGKSNIDNNVPAPQYDQSNAFTFIIFNQLSLDLNDEQRSSLGDMTENAAFSLLGSKLTSYLSENSGGFINSIRFNKNSNRDSYKLLFTGKYNNIRYSFGGNFGSNSEYLQLSKADIKFEYLISPNFLIRVEQKDPVIQTSYDEKIQEGALKYKFEF
ncbi:MAG: hypothetical protein CR986_03055 [Ignavibacteriae bacterium]|nr:MAG: hypothetical protein CR986_03055 [Ignavibacteriota bacterium]